MRKENWFRDGSSLIRQKTTDPTAALNSARALRTSGVVGDKDHWHIARLDQHVVEMWMKEEGVRMDDREGMAALLKRKMLDPANSGFRVHEGTF